MKFAAISHTLVGEQAGRVIIIMTKVDDLKGVDTSCTFGSAANVVVHERVKADNCF